MGEGIFNNCSKILQKILS